MTPVEVKVNEPEPDTQKGECNHFRAIFYAVQKFGDGKSLRLYNCPDCKTTISEQTLLREARRIRQNNYE